MSEKQQILQKLVGFMNCLRGRGGDESGPAGASQASGTWTPLRRVQSGPPARRPTSLPSSRLRSLIRPCNPRPTIPSPPPRSPATKGSRSTGTTRPTIPSPPLRSPATKGSRSTGTSGPRRSAGRSSSAPPSPCSPLPGSSKPPPSSNDERIMFGTKKDIVEAVEFNNKLKPYVNEALCLSEYIAQEHVAARVQHLERLTDELYRMAPDEPQYAKYYAEFGQDIWSLIRALRLKISQLTGDYSSSESDEGMFADNVDDGATVDAHWTSEWFSVIESSDEDEDDDGDEGMFADNVEDGATVDAHWTSEWFSVIEPSDEDEHHDGDGARISGWVDGFGPRELVYEDNLEEGFRNLPASSPCEPPISGTPRRVQSPRPLTPRPRSVPPIRNDEPTEAEVENAIAFNCALGQFYEDVESNDDAVSPARLEGWLHHLGAMMEDLEGMKCQQPPHAATLAPEGRDVQSLIDALNTKIQRLQCRDTVEEDAPRKEYDDCEAVEFNNRLPPYVNEALSMIEYFEPEHVGYEDNSEEEEPDWEALLADESGQSKPWSWKPSFEEGCPTEEDEKLEAKAHNLKLLEFLEYADDGLDYEFTYREKKQYLKLLKEKMVNVEDLAAQEPASVAKWRTIYTIDPQYILKGLRVTIEKYEGEVAEGGDEDETEDEEVGFPDTEFRHLLRQYAAEAEEIKQEDERDIDCLIERLETLGGLVTELMKSEGSNEEQEDALCLMTSIFDQMDYLLKKPDTEFRRLLQQYASEVEEIKQDEETDKDCLIERLDNLEGLVEKLMKSEGSNKEQQDAFSLGSSICNTILSLLDKQDEEARCG